MNRIILIGNGFDLAHGLKTSYKDFINWYWLDFGAKLLRSQNRIEADGLCSFKLNNNIININLSSWSYVWGFYYKRQNPFAPWDVSKVIATAKNNKELCDFSFTSELFKRICEQVSLGWVDIENEYFSLLTKEKISLDNGSEHPNYKELNNHLDILRDKLIQYLKSECEKDFPVIDKIGDIMVSPIKEREISPSFKNRSNSNVSGDIKPNATMLLNFNYTNTPEQYLSKDSNTIVNYIHGNLNKPEGVIFGYGDELDSGFKDLMDLNNNECLRHIKSIRYLESENYIKMLEFIEADSFQVIIMGHSCGNSDRTLLNTLFEHRNCVSIKPYFYIMENGTDNYIDIIQNISRNFTDMKLMRDRVVNKMYCETIV